MAAVPLPRWLQRRLPTGQSRAWCRTALATQASLQEAVDDIGRQLRGCRPAELALVFVSASFASDLPRLLPLLQLQVRASHWLGCLGGGVVGTGRDQVAHELEQEPALGVTLLHLPGTRVQPFAIDTANLPDLDGPASPWRALLGLEDSDSGAAVNGGAMLLLLDPSSPAINDLIAGLDYACPGLTKLGGIAAPHSASHGSLLLGDGVQRGAIGCLIDGAWTLEPVVAQGCRPIGPVLDVEQAERNVVLAVSEGGQGQHSPVAALQAILQELSPEERELLKHSLFLGVGRDSFQLDGDGGSLPPAFLVRNLLGVDPRLGAVAVAERMRVGQRVQFQLRDRVASRQELTQLLRQQQRSHAEPPLALLLFACLGRGRGLYGEPDGDVSVAREVFGSVPIAGAFCNGEIGPVGGSTHLHGYTASWGLVVPSYRREAGAT